MTPNDRKYAGFSQRLLAHNIDLLPILLLLYGTSYLIPNSDWDWIWYSLVYFIYHIGFELSTWKATPGKRWCKIHIHHEKKQQTTFRSIVRNLSKVVSLMLFFGGFIMILLNERKKAFHDYLAGTLVLFDED